MQWLTLEQVKERFQVKDNRTIIVKFAQEGLKFIKIGSLYRFDIKDIEEFEQKLKNEQQERLIQKYPTKIKRKVTCKTVNVDFEKRKINLTQNRVVI